MSQSPLVDDILHPKISFRINTCHDYTLEIPIGNLSSMTEFISTLFQRFSNALALHFSTICTAAIENTPIAATTKKTNAATALIAEIYAIDIFKLA